MKPFLILQSRPDVVADDEFSAFLKYGELSESEVRRVRMEEAGIPEINLDDYSGVIVGGGPYCMSDAEDKKPKEQKRFEGQLTDLVKEIIEKDFPFFGACYGISPLFVCKGGEISKEKFGEVPGAVDIFLTEEGKKEELLKDLPETFRAMVGHKESCQEVPEGVTLLASSKECPVHMIKVKNNVYGAQFHPELDTEGLILRINIYKHKGYFPPEDAEKLIEEAKKENITVPQEILRRFVEKYRK